VTKYIRLGNAGENKLFEQCSKSADWKFNLKFEYTPRDTPQHNHMAELGLTVISNKGRALLIRANIPWKYQFHLYREAFKMATDLDRFVIVSVNGKRASCYQHTFGQNPQWAKHLRLFGEAGMVKIVTNTSPKLSDKGVQCMMVGYVENHDGDVLLYVESGY
jgi:hypothetical protein